jgi:hypothetical protein
MINMKEAIEYIQEDSEQLREDISNLLKLMAGLLI